MSPVRLLLISGSLRAGSSNTAVLATARVVAPEGVVAELYPGLRELPHVNPDEDLEGATPHPAVAALRSALGTADALLVCTPEYAGALPGSFKNLLEWTVGGGETYRMPVAWINAAGPAAPTGAADAHASLRKVLEYTGAEILESACARIPVERSAVGSDGLVGDPQAREAIGASVLALARHVSESTAP